MRADATHRLLLNAILFSKFSIEVTDDKFVRFTIIEGTEASSYMLRVRPYFPSFSSWILTDGFGDRLLGMQWRWDLSRLSKRGLNPAVTRPSSRGGGRRGKMDTRVP
jgi:hypothetical protein